MSHHIAVSLLSDPGCHRAENQDAGVVLHPRDPEVLESKGVLMAVADGMGGHQGGQVASRLAIDVIARAYYAGAPEPRQALVEAFQEANRAIAERARQHSELRGMGTTCTAVALLADGAEVAHVGDTRLYLFRDGGVYRLTEDHSEVMELVRRGVLTLQEARHHEDRNVILRAVGTRPQLEVSTWDAPMALRAGDHLLICSDGLHDLVEDEELRQAVASMAPEEACRALIGLARSRGGYDNITVAVAALEPAGGEEAVARETRSVEVRE